VRESPRPLVLSPKSSQSTELLVGSSNNCPGDGGPGGFGGEILKIPEPLRGQGWRLGDGSDRRYLLKYYTQVLSGLVTTNHENNSFLSGEWASLLVVRDGEWGRHLCMDS
jgi:hypothetical protein